MILDDTVCGAQGILCCVWTGAEWQGGAEGKPTGDGFTPENEKSPPANGVSKETKPGCAANTGTGNDSGCPLARLPLVTFEFMVCKGTADGGGNTWALECTF